jgi:polyisoprenyl-phosphate glycosyltransferase
MQESRKQLVANKQAYISCVVPLYNEQDNIINFITELNQQLAMLSHKYEIIMIDDGSQDSTSEKALSLTNEHIKLIALSRNFGKENALTAGMEHCSGDVAILIDADFQHPIALLPVFLNHWADGYDMAYGVRKNRNNESFIGCFFAKFFYFIAKLSHVNIPKNAGDFRLLDKKVVAAINSMEERNRFMKGLYTWVGFKSIAVPFDVIERKAGKTGINFFDRIELALTGIASFSNMPLRIWSLIGILISFIAFIYGAYIVFKTLLFGTDIPGYATIIVAIMFFGGIQLLSIGILGEYLARIFTEVKQRPKYIITKKVGIE